MEQSAASAAGRGRQSGDRGGGRCRYTSCPVRELHRSLSAVTQTTKVYRLHAAASCTRRDPRRPLRRSGQPTPRRSAANRRRRSDLGVPYGEATQHISQPGPPTRLSPKEIRVMIMPTRMRSIFSAPVRLPEQISGGSTVSGTRYSRQWLKDAASRRMAPEKWEELVSVIRQNWGPVEDFYGDHIVRAIRSRTGPHPAGRDLPGHIWHAGITPGKAPSCRSLNSVIPL